MTRFVDLPDAIRTYVHPRTLVALEGFSHLVPFAAGHEIIRQGIGELDVVRMVPDLLVDQMIGMGSVRSLTFSWAGNPGLGSLYRFRDAVEHAWPLPLRLVEHSHAQLANRFVAGASHVPFAVMRGEQHDDLSRNSRHVQHVSCPFTGEVVSAVRAINPDTTIVHAQASDRSGNVWMGGVSGVSREAVYASRDTVVTVERVVEDLPLGPAWISHRLISAVVVLERGAWPSYALGADYARDDSFYREWRHISRDRAMFAEWMREHVLEGQAVAP